MSVNAKPDAVELHIAQDGEVFGYVLDAEGNTLAILEFQECDCGEHGAGRCLLAKVHWEALGLPSAQAAEPSRGQPWVVRGHGS